jgi:hypothetical protein
VWVHRKIPPVNFPAQPALMTDSLEQQLNTELKNLTQQDTEQQTPQTSTHTGTIHAPQETTAIAQQTQPTDHGTQKTTTIPPQLEILTILFTQN